MQRPKRRHNLEMHTGIFADLGVMLMIFFLVCTTFETDLGINMKLAPWTDEEITYAPSEMPIPFRIDINSKNEVMADSKIVKAEEIKLLCKVFIEGHVRRDLVTVIHFRVNRHSSYEMYIAVLNEIKAAYNELWDVESKRLYNKEYRLISPYQKRKIRRKYPLAMMEHESNIYLDTF